MVVHGQGVLRRQCREQGRPVCRFACCYDMAIGNEEWDAAVFDHETRRRTQLNLSRQADQPEAPAPMDRRISIGVLGMSPLVKQPDRHGREQEHCCAMPTGKLCHRAPVRPPIVKAPGVCTAQR